MSQKNAKTSKKSDPKQKINWTRCSKCGFAFLATLIDEAHECFSFNPSFDSVFLTSDLCLLTQVDHTPELFKDLHIGKDYLFDFAFLNASTIKTANIQLDDLIVVHSKESQANLVFTCWSSAQLDCSQIALNNYYLSINGMRQELNPNLYWKKIDKSHIKTAKSLSMVFQPHLSSVRGLNLDDEDAKQDLDLILSFLKEKHLNKAVLLNQNVFVTFMGQKVVFKITNIRVQPNKNQNKNKHDSNMDSIANQMDKSLSLDETKSAIWDQFKEIVSKDLEFYKIDSKTKIDYVKNESEPQKEVSNQKPLGFNYLGGLEKEIEILKEFFIRPFENNELYKRIGIEISKGVLLYGPNGCGKTTLARAVCNESKCAFVELKTAEIYSRNYGETEAKLKAVFNEAWQKSPCIVFIDEIDTLCGRRETLNQESEKRIVSLFTTLLDESKSKNILFLCTTSKIDQIDLGLRRPGRLDKEVEVPIPNQLARLNILKNHLKKLDNCVSEEDLVEISMNCHGYVGADLEMLVQEAGLICVKRLIQANQTNGEQKLSGNDLNLALRKVKPSAMREISFDIPKVYWHQIGGQHELKKKLEQAIIWPIRHADSFKRLSIKPPRGLLMYGPPGCSKTMIAKALATETGLNFIAVKGPELFSKWVGESERMVREIFRKARNAAPAIIFFDEIDAVAMERSTSANKSNNVGDRVLAQLLNEMDGVENLNDVTIVAATNRPDMIDKALMRPGRLDRIVYVSLPDYNTRKEIFELKLKQIPVSDDVQLETLVQKTEKYSGAEITALCNEAAFLALETNINCAQVSMCHFEKALSLVTPRTSDETIRYFDNFSFNSDLHAI